jgi:hypothetical protein
MVRFAQISLKKWVSLRSLAGVGLVSVAKVLWRRRPCRIMRPAFPEAFWSVSAGESSQVLGGGREEKFVVGSVRTP